jgi:release factor glutamine methyltransferase
MTLAALLRTARQHLTEAGVADAALDARLLIEHFSGTTRADAIADPERSIDPEAVQAVEAALTRRAAGEPVHRILGHRDFYGLRLALSPETLEPRPDTETLVDAVLPFVNRTVARQGGCSILDLGAGTGAVALALLSAAPLAIATAVDISDGALATAAGNAQALGLESRFTVKKSDWFTEISGRYDAIVSNPPYIRSDDIGALQKEVRDFDPLLALDGGCDGLAAYRVLAAGARQYLKHDGVVGVETGSSQKEDVAGLFVLAGFDLIEAVRDLAGHDRVLVFKAGPKSPPRQK